MRRLGCLSTFVVIGSAFSNSGQKNLTSIGIDWDGDFSIKSGLDISKNSIINAELKHNISGWEYLSLATPLDDIPQSSSSVLRTYFAAGMAEGYLQCQGLVDSYSNFYADYWGNEKPPQEIVDFMIQNYEFLQSSSDSLADVDDYWFTVQSALRQLEGIVRGFQLSHCYSKVLDNHKDKDSDGSSILGSRDVTPTGDISLLRLLFMNAWGDMYTITTKFSLPRAKLADVEGNKLKSHRLYYPKEEIERDLRCSSLFKIAADNADVLFGHATWASYIALAPRTLKNIGLPVIKSAASSSSVSSVRAFELRHSHFSSSPGALASLDDFYIVASASTHLAVIETTNDLFNVSLFDLVTPNSSLCWLRGVVANALATGGETWTSTFSKYASGTYTNQWQVFDLNLFTPGQPLPADSFWLLEEIPGQVVSRDLTEVLVSQGYWASYNVPYFQEIYSNSGNEAACKLLSKSGNTDYCWSSAPRANIFRERAPLVSDLTDLRYLINYNDWQNDAWSLSDACKSIACRRDLETDPELRYPSGGTDAKISSYLNSVKQPFPVPPLVAVRLGPTHDDQPVFCWSKFEGNYTHAGQPDCFAFDWVAI